MMTTAVLPAVPARNELLDATAPVSLSDAPLTGGTPHRGKAQIPPDSSYVFGRRSLTLRTFVTQSNQDRIFSPAEIICRARP